MPEALAGRSVRDVLSRAASRLADAGCETPRLDAEILLAWVLGADRARLVIDARVALDVEVLARFDALAARRAAREPVAYITGLRAFRRLSLAVDPRVLIPRPETELLVEVALSVVPGGRVLDVGTGSGAVALSLKDERPDLSVSGVDVSADAVAVAAGNAERLGLDVAFRVSDLLDDVAGRLDAVLANLPYVCDGDALPPEVGVFEPRLALFGGPDGLDLVRRLVSSLTAPVRFVALEIGLGQASVTAEIVSAAGFGDVRRVRDLAGIERVVTGSR